MLVSLDTFLVTVSDGSIIPIKDYSGELVYIKEGRTFKATTLKIKKTIKSSALKYTFEDGSSIIIGGKFKTNFSFFYTYYNPVSTLKSRIIDSLLEYNSDNLQRNILYNYYNPLNDLKVIYNSHNIIDDIAYLSNYAIEEYEARMFEISKKFEGFFLLNKECNYFYSKNFNDGESNPRFSGLSNKDLIDLCRVYLSSTGQRINTVRTLLKHLKKIDNRVPLTLGKFRPSIEEMYEYVFLNKPFKETKRDIIDTELLVSSMTEERIALINYIKRYFYQDDQSNKRRALNITNVEEVESVKLVNIPKGVLLANCDLYGNYRSCSGIISR